MAQLESSQQLLIYINQEKRDVLQAAVSYKRPQRRVKAMLSTISVKTTFVSSGTCRHACRHPPSLHTTIRRKMMTRASW